VNKPLDKRRCPRCGEMSVVPIVYGMPGPGMFQQYERGEVLLGGCCISPDGDPIRGCTECDWRAKPRARRAPL